jgi:RecA-family ATPase
MMTTDENKNVYTDGQMDEDLWAVTLERADAQPPKRRSQVMRAIESNHQEDPMLEEEKPRFKLLTRAELHAMPDPEWIVPEVLAADSFAVLYGAPGAAKSFMALDLACSIASGHIFHGAVVKRGQVLVSVGEGLRGMKWREEAWTLAHHEADTEALDRNLHILPRAVHLLEEKEADMFINTAEYIAQTSSEPLRLVIIDTLARAMVGGDENSAKDMGMAVDVCERIRRATGATVLAVHHSGVEGTRERGSTSLRGAADTSIMMQKDEGTNAITFAPKKMKDYETPAPRQFILSQYGHSAVLLPTQNTNGYIPGKIFKKTKDDYQWGREPF